MFQAELGNHHFHIIAETLDRPILSSLPRLAMTRQINRDNAIRLRELGHLVVPKTTAARPTMNEDQCRLALALNRIMNRHTISSVNHFGLRLSLSHRKSKHEQQQNSQKHIPPHSLVATKKHKMHKKTFLIVVRLQRTWTTVQRALQMCGYISRRQ